MELNRIQDVIGNCYSGVQSFASHAVSGIGSALSAVGSAAVDTTGKVAKFAQPYFEKLTKFAGEHRHSIIVAAVACAFGAIATIIFQRTCSGEGSAPTVPVTVPVTARA